MFIGAYWSQRQESQASAGARVGLFLRAAANSGPEFSEWFRRGASRAAALRFPIHLDDQSISNLLKPNRRDVDGQPIPGLGFTVGVWNGSNASFAATLGCSNDRVLNSAVLDLGQVETPAEPTLQALLQLMVLAFEPDHAVVTSHQRLAEAGASKPWEVGVFAYHKEP